jgi:hypothetical protein
VEWTCSLNAYAGKPDKYRPSPHISEHCVSQALTNYVLKNPEAG